MAELGPMPGSWRQPCPHPDSPPLTPGTQINREEIEQAVLALRSRLGTIATGIEALTQTLTGRIKQRVGKCRTWARSLCSRVRELAEAGGVYSVDVLKRMEGDCRQLAAVRCREAGRVGRCCAAKCVLRLEGNQAATLGPDTPGPVGPGGPPPGPQYMPSEAEEPGLWPRPMDYTNIGAWLDDQSGNQLLVRVLTLFPKELQELASKDVVSLPDFNPTKARPEPIIEFERPRPL